MVWREVSVLGERREFVHLASLEGANVSALCARFGISRQTGHLWLRRFAEGERDFGDRSRRPLTSPGRIAPEREEAILAVRQAHPAWGARKIAAVLRRHGEAVPAVSTVHAVLARHGCINEEAASAKSHGRFEHERPNGMWQMDFKGRVPLEGEVLCHPLTVLDDHSRYLIGLEACADQRTATVRARLERMLKIHGLPDAIYVDNGSPWGGGRPGQWTPLGVWLLKLGVRVIHGRPYHPQGRGKCERLHRSLAAEVFSMARLRDLAEAQRAMDRWRALYNRERPHEALGLNVPASRYRASQRPFPSRLPEPDYPAGDIVRRVPESKGYLRFKGRLWNVPKAFAGEYVAIRPLPEDGRYGVFFGAIRIANIDLAKPKHHENL
jgi:transposase InsO family protein